MELFIKILVAGGVLGVMDFLWLSLAAKKLYASEMGSMMLEKPNLIPAALFYIIYIVGVIVFVVNPALSKGSVWHAAGYGALFGLIAYATYGLTNLAAIKGFSDKVIAIDILWGAFLTCVVATVTYLAVSVIK